ncbi:hypothetical protein ACWEN6_13460 [Sphaerisporangium sp. NPDC004334]
MSLFDLLANWIRTGVAAAIGAVIAWFAVRGIDIDPTAAAGVVLAVGSACTLVYQVLVTSLQARWPILGILLGVPRSPIYDRDLPPVQKYHPGVHTGSDM